MTWQIALVFALLIGAIISLPDFLKVSSHCTAVSEDLRVACEELRVYRHEALGIPSCDASSAPL